MNITHSLHLLQRISAELHGHHQVAVKIHKSKSIIFIFMNWYGYGRLIRLPDGGSTSRPKPVAVNIMNK